MVRQQNGPTREQILDALREVCDPELRKSIVELDMVRQVEVRDGQVTVDAVLTISGCPLRDAIVQSITERVKALPGVAGVTVNLGVMSADQRQALIGRLRGGEMHPARRPAFLTAASATRVIAVASGKGGVGKSTVTANLATAMALDGHTVGVIDADVYGFSIPRMLGVFGRPTAVDQMLIPIERDGIRVMSIGFLLPDEGEAVVWRGPLLHKALVTFITEVHWGDDLDYLFIDLPPGTGDVSLTIAQTLPQASMLIVTTPQPAAAAVAQRAAKMAEKVNMDVIGVVENMSGFTPPGGPTIDLFGRGGGLRLAEQLGVPLLGEIPLDIAVREGSDAGEPVVRSRPDAPAARALREIARKVADLVPVGAAP
ncbi:MAG: Mrp/NBP35 family ATP-binding protein [Armatimonadota bacterium]|nr:Mrp/NBP35 family ATP-binding protein [Armatimonadota bacterium]MDR7423580.1 Mrp/NBP35 family ATP-binding protein [Armatimonadota bacterium]MDR7453802.1 Mrp/NBP35 family ATP-binding protein [Armatimonadota bacterium]MDR7455947.1 Mrp/NBP35 family ATP-binding protein [Armatimonadota bacterium]MDR7496182.1 Mrp/NBP35 family ATP-binding protein [Armatimonadota bacterium]